METKSGSNGAPAPSAEEYAGMSTDGAGGSIKMDVRTLERKNRQGLPAIVRATHENGEKGDLVALSGEVWSWSRHSADGILPHCGQFRSLIRCTAMIAAALDESSLQRLQALLCQMYTEWGSAARDPNHDLTRGWVIRDPEGRTQPDRTKTGSTAVIAFRRKYATIGSTRKLLAVPEKNEKGAEDDGVSQVRPAVKAAAQRKE